MGPMGLAGPVIHVPMPPTQPVTVPAKDANITISNDGMERSFRTLSDSLTQMFTQQASLNQTLHSHLTQGIQAQGDLGGSLAVVRSYALGCEPLVTGNLAMGLTIRSSHKQELSSVYQFIDVLYSLCIYEALRH